MVFLAVGWGFGHVWEVTLILAEHVRLACVCVELLLVNKLGYTNNVARFYFDTVVRTVDEFCSKWTKSGSFSHFIIPEVLSFKSGDN